MMASSSSSTAADDAPPSSADKASLRCQAPGTINLAVGHPRELPSDVLAAAMTRSAAALRSDDARDRDAVPLKYVARRGPPAILETFASFLTDAYDGGRRPPRASSSSSSSSSSSPVTAASLVITNGVSHGLDLACGALTSPGDVVVMEIPTYFLAAAVFRDHGLEVIGVPGTDGEFEDDGGAFDVDALERRLVDDGLRPKVVYLVPTHSNPRGGTLGTDGRRRLVSLARRFGFYIFADEVYHALHWGEDPPPPRFFEIERAMTTLEEDEGGRRRDGGRDADEGDDDDDDDDDARGDVSVYSDAWGKNKKTGSGGGEEENAPKPGVSSQRGQPPPPVVVSASSFTKILAPGLRLGWLECDPSLATAIANRGYVVSGGCVAPFTAGVVAQAILSGDAADWLTKLRDDYRESSAALARAVEAETGGSDGCAWSFASPSPPRGGYFAWIKLPAGMRAASLAEPAAREGVAFLRGGQCAPTAGDEDAFDACDGHVRVCFAFLTADEIEEGVRRLAKAVRSVAAAEAAS